MAVTELDLSMYQDNKIIIDWVTFTCFADVDPHEFFYKFIRSDIEVTELDRGLYGYKKSIFAGHIRLFYDGSYDMGICFDMSGQGCREFEEWGNMDFNAFLNYVNVNEACFFTRLDIAYDDFTGVLDIDQLCCDCIYNNLVCKWRSGLANIGFLSNQGKNLQFGSSTSEILVRIYDKSAERDLLEYVPHWIRCELQLRADRANSFVYQIYNIGETIESLYFGVLTNYLRFVEPNANESNRARWKTKDYWTDFLNGYAGKRLFKQVGVEYNLSKLERNVLNMYGNSIYTYLQIHSLKSFLSDINAKGDKLPPKYKGLIDAYKFRKAEIDSIGEK